MALFSRIRTAIPHLSIWHLITGIVIIFIIVGIYSITPPRHFSPQTISIEKGDTVRNAAMMLEQRGIIRSDSIFSILILFYGSTVVEGEYRFEKPVSIFTVLKRVTSGEYGLEIREVTFIEGGTVVEMAQALIETFPHFDSDEFLRLATAEEGYLFPDTYRFRVNVDPETVLVETKKNFLKKISEHQAIIDASPHSLQDVVTMASIIEKEATADSRQVVSNILWKRISLGMPLQVDAPFVYAIDKGTFDLSRVDLETDHPYNTYTRLGLTPTPIGNPGIDAIIAAANPQPTSYLYFLTGRDGNMYYAETFEGHKRNRLLYLD